jgi:hypothetical protein
MAKYSAATNENQGSFNNPRQKTWAVITLGSSGWGIKLTTNDFNEAKELARITLNKGGMFTSINRIMVVEIIPIDTVITPSV